MKLSVNAFLSLDGVMQGPGGPDEDRSNGFDRGGWLVPYANDEGMGEIVDDEWFSNADAILLGRNTYEMMKGFWTQIAAEHGGITGIKLNTGPKYVVSKTLQNPDWQNTTVLSGDVLEEVAELKKKPGGELQVHGSAQLARTLAQAGLVDVFRLLVFPVTVGKGKRLFDEGDQPWGFELVETRSTGKGAVYSVLTPTPFKSGTIAVDGEGREILL